MAMMGGYPAEADIDAFLEDRGIELVSENNENFIAEFKQFVWGLFNRLDWGGTLAVYCPSTTTFNVAGGQYVFKGVVKTYTPGAAINPTDNDTTYVWLTPANAVGSGIDGSGWPATEHLKLAEVDVDADGVITDIRDLRGQVFLSYNAAAMIESHTSGDTLTWAESGSVHTNLGATGTVTLTLPASAPAGTRFTFAVQAAYELRVDPGAAAIRDDSGQTADKYKSADAIGECITLVADANGDWVTIAKNGTWTEE